MQFSLHFHGQAQHWCNDKMDAVIWVVPKDQWDAVKADLPPQWSTVLEQAKKDGDWALQAKSCLYLHSGVLGQRMVWVCAASAAPSDVLSAVTQACVSLKALSQGGVDHLGVAVLGDVACTPAHVLALVRALDEKLYVYTATKPSARQRSALKRVTLGGSAAPDKAQLATLKTALKEAQAMTDGIALARELGNLPSNACTPTYLAEQVQLMGQQLSVDVQVLERKQIEKLGMGSFLSVTQGSQQPPKFIVAQYWGAGKDQAPIVLVGKGITFDTGGISLKPPPGMDEMKFDMCGAASVIGTMKAIAQLKPTLNLVVLVPTCENMPSGTATKPGDVVTSMSGQTIEVLNTDAEGRLILCDALTYAERFQPSAVVDVATLTGACIIALGHHHAGLFCADDELAQALVQAGQQSIDTCWRMPLDEVYAEGLKSNFADMANVGGRDAGSVTAACFLAKFTKNYRWAHLDIAGVSHRSGLSKGATGRPVSLLTRFVLDFAASAAATAAQSDEGKKVKKPKARLVKTDKTSAN